MDSSRPPDAYGATERPGRPARGQVRRLGLAGAAGAVGRCRDFTDAALHDWGWLPTSDPDLAERADDVLLLVSELVTNACLHGGAPCELALTCTDAVLRVEVADHNTQLPQLKSPHRPEEPGGHGLHVVTQLALHWGTVRRAEDKTVWLEVAAPPPDGRRVVR